MTRGLPSGLRSRLESAFGRSLAGIAFLGSEVLGNAGVPGLAAGRTVYVAPAHLGSINAGSLRVLSHEIAHVFQQLAGQAKPTTHLQGWPVCNDPGLEHEAREIADRVAGGRDVRGWNPRQCTASGRFALQFFLSAEGLPVEFRIQNRDVEAWQPGNHRTNLPDRVRMALALVPGSGEWLDWTCRDARPVVFATHRDLIKGVASGLTGSSMLHLAQAGLDIGIDRLWELGDSSFHRLLEAQTSVEQECLSRDALAGRVAIANSYQSVADWCVKAGVAAGPDRQRTPASDLLVHELCDRVAQSALAQEVIAMAARFASMAPGWRTFIERFWFAVQWNRQVNNPKRASTPRTPDEQAIRLAWQRLVPCGCRFLGAPRIDDGVTLDSAINLIRSWVRQGGSIGFETLGSALCNLISYSNCAEVLTRPPDPAPSGPELSSELEQQSVKYFAEAMRLLAEAPARFLRTTQDGAERLILLQQFQKEAILALDRAGTVTLQAFNPGRETQLTPNPTPTPTP